MGPQTRDGRDKWVSGIVHDLPIPRRKRCNDSERSRGTATELVETSTDQGLAIAATRRYHAVNDPAFPGTDGQWHGAKRNLRMMRIDARVRWPRRNEASPDQRCC